MEYCRRLSDVPCVAAFSFENMVFMAVMIIVSPVETKGKM
jgi:hypothetical protein